MNWGLTKEYKQSACQVLCPSKMVDCLSKNVSLHVVDDEFCRFGRKLCQFTAAKADKLCQLARNAI